MISIQDLNKRYGKVVAVKDLNLQVKKGTIHGLIGPEACGKTTVLKILSTLIRPDSGKVTVNNIPLGRSSQVRKITGFVPKTPHLPPEYTAQGLVEFAATLHGIRDRNIINDTLKKTGIDAVAGQGLDRFSQAMEKNVAIAMALVHDPEILLLDEPMVGLDPVSQKRLKELLLASNKTVLMTGQDLDAVDGLCSSVTVLQRGSVIVNDELSSLRQKIGKGVLEIKLYDTGSIQKLLFELEKARAKAAVSGESIYVHFDKESEVPNMIRIAAGVADIMEARQVKLSIDDIFAKYVVENK